MPLALGYEEKTVIETVLWFANLKRIKSTKQIEDRFSLLPLVPGRFKVIEPEKVDAYRHDQAILRRWLELIAKGQAGRKSAEIELTNQLAATVETELGFSQGRIIYQYGLTGVQAICSFGTALILDNSYELTTRLQQCGYSKCKKFNLDFKPKGRPRRFCNETCKKKYDLETGTERVRKYRERLEKAALKKTAKPSPGS